jgi:hypothetical protein
MKVFSLSQLLGDLKDQYKLSSSEITDLRTRLTVSIFSGQVNVFNCGGSMLKPQPISIIWAASNNPSYISSDEINKLLSYSLPTYFWNPQHQMPQRGAPKSGKSIKAILSSGELKIEATKYAKAFENNSDRMLTRVDVAKGLVRGVYKDFNFAPKTLKNSLRKSWWKNK